MTTFITTTFLGLMISILGIINMSGNISSLHWYHRQKVSAENVKPFGRLVGLGTLICGAALVFYGVMFLVFEKTAIAVFSILGAAVMAMGLLFGMGVSIYAIIKYNRGIF